MMTMLVPRRRHDFDLFDSFLRDDFFPRPESSLMKTDIKEKKNHYLIEMDLPGFDKENITVDLEDGYLRVSAKLEQQTSTEEDERYVRQERFYGQCARSFYVGDDLTKQDVKAEFKNGILKITLPKKDPEEKLPEHKHIDIA